MHFISAVLNHVIKVYKVLCAIGSKSCTDSPAGRGGIPGARKEERKEQGKRERAEGNFSQFTSWTYSRSNATLFAAEKGGVVVSALFSKDELVFSPNLYAEKEVLVLGQVRNMDVYLMKEDYNSVTDGLELVPKDNKILRFIDKHNS